MKLWGAGVGEAAVSRGSMKLWGAGFGEAAASEVQWSAVNGVIKLLETFNRIAS